MCGIAGILYDDPARPAADLKAALAALHHRGPDDRGVYADGPLAIGMTRLSIIDLAGGHQPMADASGRYWIVFNGEIFNYRELRAELSAAGYPFHTTSDTEVILAGYSRWGVEVLERLNGMFAFALWDRQQRRLWLARDRLGVKPLYYTRLAGALRFASEIKAILTDPEVPRQLSPVGLANYLAYGHAIAPHSMFEGIFKLPPAHHLAYQDGRLEVAAYWQVPATGEPAIASLPQAIAHSRALVEEAVRSHMIADVPVGAFLSGGIDSATVTALMAREVGRVKTFSLGFEDDPRSELSAAAALARRFGTEHYETRVTYAALPPLLETLVYHYDEPFGDASSFPTYLVAALARQHVKVVLTGDGGDELFGGYVRYRAEHLAPWVQAVPHPLRQAALTALRGVPRRQHRLRRILRITLESDDALRYAGWSEVFTRDQREAFIQSPYRAAGYDVYGPFKHVFQQGRAHDRTNRAMYADLHLRLPNDYLEKVDKATMAVSLEARVPLLDYRLVELAQRIPSRFKLTGQQTKVMFRRAVADLLPDDVLNLPKHGFSVPTRLWFQGALKTFVLDHLTDERARARGIFDTNAVRALWADHQDQRGVYDYHLWLLLNFELWARQYLDRQAIMPPAAPAPW